MPCSQCQGIEEQFNDAEARKKLRRLRRRGPDRTTKLLIAAIRRSLEDRELHEPALLDVGAGIGAIHHELLDAGVARAVHVDASSAHMSAAREEAARRGHDARVAFVQGDFVDQAKNLDEAEIVTLDRVICCYDDMTRLVSLSAAKAMKIYGAVYPRRRVWMPALIAATNLLMRLRKSPFRVFLHDPEAIDGVLRQNGLGRTYLRRTVAWEVVLYERG
jgi:2-polyprenyl-3-methyl-5-hydroxy-6-metoxy-1,4-benzoquinol methylase